MLAKIWFVAAKDLRHVFKDRTALLMMFAVPLLLMGLLGAALGNAFSASSIQVTLPVVNHDRGPASRQLIAALQSAPSLRVQLKSDEGAVKKSVRNGDDAAAIIIPDHFTSALRAAHPAARVTFYTVSNNNSADSQVAMAVVKSVVQRFALQNVVAQAVAGAEQQVSGHVVPASVQQIAARAATTLDSAPPVALRTVNATGKAVNVQDNTVPGYALMFALFALSNAAGTILQEKEDGTFKRLLIAPLSPYALLGGKLLAQFLQTLIQLTVLFIAGSLLFRINLGPSIPALALIIVGTSFAATGLGFVLVSFIKNQRQLRPVTTLVVLSFSALGGSWWPIAIEPGWMQQLSKFTLNSWAMQGFNGLMIFDKSFMQILPDVGALFLYGIVCFLIARRTFRFVQA